MAEQPERVKKIIWNDKTNKNGAYRFYFWVKDGWFGTNVDDQIPSISWGSGHRPWATMPSSKGAWWMPLLEKAFAKMNQNYERLSGGLGV